ncbi:MAG: hypothetical protein XD82_1159 [Methanoculleus marisnigri]|uniref:Uncharacterized protein n=1 Tax=Methanoculleus marisnigri TaxID=2198 RepID=A0A101GMV6_9EURY|nr:MAG: hypothetical protein XD82_1159 [Methanoculleus marisnigri]
MPWPCLSAGRVVSVAIGLLGIVLGIALGDMNVSFVVG